MYQRAGTHLWTPPPNFSMVEKGIYRSAYPTLPSVPYLKHIGIKTVVLLSIELLPGPVARALTSTEHSTRPAEVVAESDGGVHSWKSKTNTTAHPIRVLCTADLKEWICEYPQSMDDFSVSGVRRALDFALQTEFQPVLFTCPTGEVQTSVVVGCIRRYQGWTLAATLAECELFVNVSRSVRRSIMVFIERWDSNTQPVWETGVAVRMRELLLREQQHDHPGRRGAFFLHSTTDSDSELDDAVACGVKNKDWGSVTFDAQLTHHNKATIAKRRFFTGKCGEENLLSTQSIMTIALAPWYTAVLARRAAFAEELVAARKRAWDAKKDKLPDPHERYFGVLNPPALDERSSFTKESIVEEDDD